MNSPQLDHDLEALKGAAEYFEQLATMGDPAPIAFAQSIRRVIWFFTDEPALQPVKMSYDEYIGILTAYGTR